MGRRARRNGIANTAVRAARSAARTHDEQCQAIAARVYAAAVELKRSGLTDTHLPPSVYVPLVVAAETAAAGACRLAGLDVTEENADRVTAYLVALFREAVVMLDPEHLERWLAAGEEGQAAAASVHEEGSRRVGDIGGERA